MRTTSVPKGLACRAIHRRIYLAYKVIPGGIVYDWNDLLTFLTLVDSLAQRFFETHRGLRTAVELLAQKDK